MEMSHKTSVRPNCRVARHDFSYHVCKLTKSLYGLKQAPHAWFHQFISYLQSLGFTYNKTYSSMFLFRSSISLVVLLLFVDAINITGTSSTPFYHIIRLLSSHFPLKGLGNLHYFLQLQV